MPLKTHLDEQPTLNLTSMIDIVFLLIVFFMVGTEFTKKERRIPLELAKVADKGALTPAPSRRIINVYRDDKLTLDEEDVTLGQLTDRLADSSRQYRDLGVLVRGDAKVKHQRVASVLNACKQAGIRKLGISVDVLRQDE